MIEVEKKFKYTEEQKSILLYGAVFKSEKIQNDIYFDTPDFDYLKKGLRLRKRNNAWELKIKVVNPENKESSHYEEIEDEKEILKYLGFSKTDSLEKVVKEKMQVLCEIKTHRSKYKKDGFNIDLDKTDFGMEVVEIERMVLSENDINIAEKEILKYAAQYGLDIDNKINGKVVECLRLTRPDVYEKYLKIKTEILENRIKLTK